MKNVTISVNNANKPAPKWFRKFKSIFTHTENTVILLLLAKGYTSESFTILCIKLLTSWLLETMSTILANGEMYSKDIKDNSRLSLIIILLSSFLLYSCSITKNKKTKESYSKSSSEKVENKKDSSSVSSEKKSKEKSDSTSTESRSDENDTKVVIKFDKEEHKDSTCSKDTSDSEVSVKVDSSGNITIKSKKTPKEISVNRKGKSEAKKDVAKSNNLSFEEKNKNDSLSSSEKKSKSSDENYVKEKDKYKKKNKWIESAISLSIILSIIIIFFYRKKIYNFIKNLKIKLLWL